MSDNSLVIQAALGEACAQVTLRDGSTQAPPWGFNFKGVWQSPTRKPVSLTLESIEARLHRSLNRLHRNQLEIAKLLLFRSGLGFGFSHKRAERVGVMDERLLRAFVGLRHVQRDTQLRR